MRQAVGDRDVGRHDLDVLDQLAVVVELAHRPLVLVQKRDRPDEGQVLHVVAPCPRTVVEEGELLGVRVGD